MNTLSKNRSGIDPPSTESVNYVFWGAVIGVLAALASLFAMSTYYGATTGLGAVDCAVFGSFMTLLLSQPAALAGLLAGAVCGGACALVAHFAHRSWRSG